MIIIFVYKINLNILDFDVICILRWVNIEKGIFGNIGIVNDFLNFLRSIVKWYVKIGSFVRTEVFS